MKITYEEMKDIAKTLPIGYYLGRRVEVMIDPSGGAYADIVKNVIHVGFDIIRQAADHIDAAEAAKWDRENLLRCVLYHEVGHLLLTHEYVGRYTDCVEYLPFKNSKVRDWAYDLGSTQRHAIMNIFEDERLECILSSFFMGVDFKAFCKLVNKGCSAKDDIMKLGDIIRLRKTTKEISDRVDDIIDKHCGISAGRNDNYVYDLMKSYVGDVLTLAYDLIHTPPKDEKKDEKSDEAGKPDESDDSSDGSPDDPSEDKRNPTEGKDEGKDEGKGEDKGKDGDDEDDGEDDGKGDDGDSSGEDGEDKDGDGGTGEEGDSSEASSENAESVDGDPSDAEDDESITPRKPHVCSDFLANAADGLFATPTPEVGAKFDQLARRLAKRKGLHAAGCYSALHGKINVKRDAMDKDRIFRRSSDVGDMINSGTNITLWVDVSGSFASSVPILNRILSAANRVMSMSRNMSISVVKMNDKAVVAGDNNWEIEAGGGNYIGKSYLNAWRKTRNKSCRNIDIVVFDGDAKSDYPDPGEEWSGRPIEQTIWDHPDCHIISDEYNSYYFDTLHNAHVTYVKGNYAERLEAEFVKIVDRIM